MLNKNKCADIFFDLEKTIDKKNLKSYLKYKYKLNNAVRQFQKLLCLRSLRCLNGELFIHVTLEMIRLSKQIFVHQIEQGQSVFIPKQLSQDGLPMSFRFYDPILRIIQSHCRDGRKEYFALKNEFNVSQIFAKNSIHKFSKFMGFDKD